MKIRSQSFRTAGVTPRAGSVLVLTIIFCTLIGIILVAYLSMLKTQHKFTHRSQTWNNCIPLCEAGVEEAMAHLNHGLTTTDFAKNGWVLISGAYRKERSLNGGMVRMMIDMSFPPVITVTGYLRAPVQSNLLERAVRVRTKVNYTYPYAFLARGAIDVSGGALIDSYDSTDPAKSTNGQYDPLKRSDEAVVATTANSSGVVKIGNVDIYGSVAVGPGGTVDKNNGTIGDVAWVANPVNDGKIQPGHFTDDVNLYIPNVQLPSPYAPVPPIPGVVGGVAYTYVLGNGDWALPSISGDTKILVTGKARLYVGGKTAIGNNGSVMIASGGSLEWYSNDDVDIKGVVNNPGLPKDLAFYGLPNCKVITMNAGAQFSASVYAPQASVTLNGNASGQGAVVASTFKINGGMAWHYDEGLGGDPREGRYVVSAWQEL